MMREPYEPNVDMDPACGVQVYDHHKRHRRGDETITRTWEWVDLNGFKHKARTTLWSKSVGKK
jgi:hypothetical protein